MAVEIAYSSVKLAYSLHEMVAYLLIKLREIMQNML